VKLIRRVGLRHKVGEVPWSKLHHCTIEEFNVNWKSWMWSA